MNNEEKILSMLETLTSTVSQIQVEQQKTNQRLDILEQGQTKLEQEIKEVKADVKEIKSDVKYLKAASDEAFKDIDMLDRRTLKISK